MPMDGNNLKLRISFEPNARIRPLVEKAVEPEGVELEWLLEDSGVLFHRHLTENKFDVFEFSLAEYMVTRPMNHPMYSGWTAIPIFMSKPLFLFRNFFVNEQAGIANLGDLRGKRLGIPDFGMTGGIWLRIMLRALYGVQASEITWINSRPPSKRHGRVLNIDRPSAPGVQLLNVEEGQSIAEMLRNGEVDAAIGASGSEIDDAPGIRRLFSPAGMKAVVAELYRKAGVTPMNHTVVVQQRLVDQHPWLPRSLFDAFTRSKLEAYARARQLSEGYLLFPDDDFARQAAEIGEDPFPLGIEANRRTLGAIAEQLRIDGLLEQLPDIAALFTPSVRNT